MLLLDVADRTPVGRQDHLEAFRGDQLIAVPWIAGRVKMYVTKPDWLPSLSVVYPEKILLGIAATDGKGLVGTLGYHSKRCRKRKPGCGSLPASTYRNQSVRAEYLIADCAAGGASLPRRWFRRIRVRGWDLPSTVTLKISA